MSVKSIIQRLKQAVRDVKTARMREDSARKQLKAALTPKPISMRGVKFIADHEGFLATPSDELDGVSTIGYGHVYRFGPVQASDSSMTWVKGQSQKGRLLPSEGRQLLKIDLDKTYSPAVTKLFKKGGPLHGKFRQNRADALTSFVYNLGVGAVGSAPGFETFQAALKSGDIRAIGDAMLLYDKSNGNALPGLTARRQRERDLFVKGKYWSL